MKTITEYGPLIFSQAAAHARQRFLQRRRIRTDLLAGAAYTAVGLWLSFDTGFVVWHWQFWLMFLPLFVAGEVAAMAGRTA